MKVNIVNSLQEIEKIALSSSEERAAYVYQSTNETGLITSFKKEEKDIKLLQLKYIGGTIYFSPGDIGIVIFDDNCQEILISLFKKLYKEIRKRGYTATLSNNDMLVNGRKIAGSASNGHLCYINLNSSLSDIEKYININSKKIPDKLTNYGFTNEEIFNIIIEHLRRQ